MTAGRSISSLRFAAITPLGIAARRWILGDAFSITSIFATIAPTR